MLRSCLQVNDADVEDNSTPSCVPRGCVFYIGLNGAVTVPRPSFRCSRCSYVLRLHPSDVGCFPSSPDSPGAWFDTTLLDFIHDMRTRAPYSAGNTSAILQHLSCGGPAVPRTYADAAVSAATHWAFVQGNMAAEVLGLESGPLDGQAGPWAECPCCWRRCPMLSTDACLGFRRFRKSAASSLLLQPLSTGDLFIPAATVRARLAQRKGTQSALLEPGACADFKAAKLFGRRHAHYDQLGIAAIVCAHGFVVSMTNLYTPENFTYYELLLESANSKVGLDNVDVLFMDVACSFEVYYKRCVVCGRGAARYPDLTRAGVCRVCRPSGLPPVRFAIGPWHIGPHKPQCNVEYNSRYMDGVGLMFGDNIEQLWAAIKRQWSLAAYMSPAAHQDRLVSLVRVHFPGGSVPPQSP